MSSLGDGNNTVGGIECRAQLDSGSCYASAKLLDLLEKQPTEIKPKKIEMLMASATARMGIFKTTVSSRSGDYSLDVNLTKVNRGSFSAQKIPDMNSCSKPTLTWSAEKWMAEMPSHCFQFMLFQELGSMPELYWESGRTCR